MTGAEGSCDASATSVEALVFLGRPRLRPCLTVDADADPDCDSGGVTSTAASTVADASRNVACWTILAAKACSTSFASSADRRFLAFRMAIARGCRSSSGKLSISRMSCALIAADSSALSFSPTGGTRGLLLLNGLALTGAAAELQFGARPASSVFVPPGPRYAKAHAKASPIGPGTGTPLHANP